MTFLSSAPVRAWRTPAPRAGSPAPKPKLDQEQAQIAKELIEGGKSVSAVARTFNVSRPTIYRALKRIEADA